MSQEVNTTTPYNEAIVKLIPTEIVGAYMVLAGFLGFSPTETSSSFTQAIAERIPQAELKALLIQIVFFFLLVLTPFYLKYLREIKDNAQVAVACVSYIVWIYTLGGPFVVWGIHYVLIGSVVLVLWALIPPIIIMKKATKS